MNVDLKVQGALPPQPSTPPVSDARMKVRQVWKEKFLPQMASVQTEEPNRQAEEPNPQAEEPNPQAEEPNPQAEEPNPQTEEPNSQAEEPNRQAEEHLSILSPGRFNASWNTRPVEEDLPSNEATKKTEPSLLKKIFNAVREFFVNAFKAVKQFFVPAGRGSLQGRDESIPLDDSRSDSDLDDENLAG